MWVPYHAKDLLFLAIQLKWTIFHLIWNSLYNTRSVAYPIPHLHASLIQYRAHIIYNHLRLTCTFTAEARLHLWIWPNWTDRWPVSALLFAKEICEICNLPDQIESSQTSSRYLLLFLSWTGESITVFPSDLLTGKDLSLADHSVKFPKPLPQNQRRCATWCFCLLIQQDDALNTSWYLLVWSSASRHSPHSRILQWL